MALNKHQLSKEAIVFPVASVLKHLNEVEQSALSSLSSELISRMDKAGELGSCPSCGSGATQMYDHEQEMCRACGYKSSDE